MLVSEAVHASCPVCGQRVNLLVPSGTVALSQDSDLCLRCAGDHPVPSAVETCRGCGFSGDLEGFQRNISPRLIEQLRRRSLFNLPPAIPRADALLPHVRYELAERTQRLLGAPPEQRASLLVKASWCLRIFPESVRSRKRRRALERSYRLRAVDLFRLALSWYPARSDVTLAQVYLTGELLRLESFYHEAEGYFDEFLEKAAEDHPLAGAARMLRSLSRLGIAKSKTIKKLCG